MKALRTVLSVAEKASVAKEITKVLGKGQVRTRILASKFNPVYEFLVTMKEEEVCMRVTSVTGHVMRLDFDEKFRSWKGIPPETLFEAPLIRSVIEDKKDTVENLKQCSQGIHTLALWLDCDREGENIAFEVVDIVKAINPSVSVLRAHFSALTKIDIENALVTMDAPDRRLSEAVEARQELDLRLGAIFTRLQTEGLTQKIKLLGGRLISYGPCQFPTMGFVVKRFLEIEGFVQRLFWTLQMTVKKGGMKAVFESSVGRCFDRTEIDQHFSTCEKEKSIKIVKVEKKRKIKPRPQPLCTIPFLKLASTKLKMDSHTAMQLAEKLYNEGFISYPRTETDKYHSTMKLRDYIQTQSEKNTLWRGFAKDLLKKGQIKVRNGTNDDKSHPAIYPVRAAEESTFSNPQEWKVYELITRHFLAACSDDAVGQECIIEAQASGFSFTAKGLSIEAPNFLAVYPYQQWSESQLPSFTEGELLPGEFSVNPHKTQAPTLLSEADLISHMDSAGIGTDSTIHLHIKTVQTRGYVAVNEKKQFRPTPLGLALYQGHMSIGNHIVEPELRASMEKGMTEIASGKKEKETMVRECLQTMKEVYATTVQQFALLEKAVRTRLLDDPSSPYFKATVVCYRCKEPGHVASQCPTLEKTSSEEKKCELCGAVGRHPRGSTCPAVKRRK